MLVEEGIEIEEHNCIPDKKNCCSICHKDIRIIIEEPDVDKANQLALSGEFCQPRLSEKRNCYILIRRKR